jgi:hypothetical protein
MTVPYPPALWRVLSSQSKCVCRIYRIFLALLIFCLGGRLMGYDDEIAGAVQILREAKLTRDVSLDNSAEVYIDIARLADQYDAIRSRLPTINSSVFQLVWTSKPATNKMAFNISFEKGTSLYDALVKTAKQRNEFLSASTYDIVIRPIGEPAIDFSALYKINHGGSRLANYLKATMLPPVDICMPKDDQFEGYINTKMQESWLRFNTDNEPMPYAFKMDETAKSEMEKVNIIGPMQYEVALNIACELTGLEWRIEGDTAWLEGRAGHGSKK